MIKSVPRKLSALIQEYSVNSERIGNKESELEEKKMKILSSYQNKQSFSMKTK